MDLIFKGTVQIELAKTWQETDNGGRPFCSAMMKNKILTDSWEPCSLTFINKTTLLQQHKTPPRRKN